MWDRRPRKPTVRIRNLRITKTQGATMTWAMTLAHIQPPQRKCVGIFVYKLWKEYEKKQTRTSTLLMYVYKKKKERCKLFPLYDNKIIAVSLSLY